jgi:hypothetical protein
MARKNPRRLVCFSPIPRGSHYIKRPEVLVKRTHLIEGTPENPAVVGSGEKVHLPFPYVLDLKDFQSRNHGHLWQKGNSVFFKDISKIGTALVELDSPVSPKALLAHSHFPRIKTIRHIKNNEEPVNVTRGDIALVFGVHPHTVSNGHLIMTEYTGNDGKKHTGFVDEHGKIYPSALFPMSARQREMRHDPLSAIEARCENMVSQRQKEYAARKGIELVTSTDPTVIGEGLADEEIELLNLANRLKNRSLDKQGLKRLAKKLGIPLNLK